MYAHPSFIRGRKDDVAQLRKGGGNSNGTTFFGDIYFRKKQHYHSQIQDMNTPAAVSVTSSSRSSSFSSQEDMPPCLHLLQKQKDGAKSLLFASDISGHQRNVHTILSNSGRSKFMYSDDTKLTPIQHASDDGKFHKQPISINNCSKLELLTLALSSLADV